MNAANADRSARLRRFMGVLSDHGWHGTREIVHTAEIMAVNSVASECRQNGIPIECRCVGRGRYEYRWPQRTAPTEQMALIAA